MSGSSAKVTRASTPARTAASVELEQTVTGSEKEKPDEGLKTSEKSEISKRGT